MIKKEESIEEAIKCSSPPSLKNDIPTSSPYSGLVVTSNNTNLYTPSPVFSSMTPVETTITTITTVNNTKPAITTTSAIENESYKRKYSLNYKTSYKGLFFTCNHHFT